MFERLVVASSVALVAACGATSASRPMPRGGPGSAHVLDDEPRIGAYISSPWAFSTASYWISGPDGLVLIDTQFLPSAAEELVDLAERETGKRVVLAIVLHANPDKYNGVGVLRRRGIRVVSAAPVVERIPVIDVERRASFAARYAPDYPERLVLPESFGEHTRDLDVAGLRLRLHVLGRGCSNAHVVVQWDAPNRRSLPLSLPLPTRRGEVTPANPRARHLFAGDLLANGAHSWLQEADLDGWLARVAEMQALSPHWVHPGRGASDGPRLLARQAEYLRFVQERIARAEPRLPIDDTVVTQIREDIERRFAGYAFSAFLRVGVREAYRRAAERRRDAAAPGTTQSPRSS